MHTRKGGKYDRTHQAARTRYEPLVAAGQAHCTEPICLMRSRIIQPGTPWDLAHNRHHDGYLGPAHARCNRSEGATYGNRLRGTARHRRLPAW